MEVIGYLAARYEELLGEGNFENERNNKFEICDILPMDFLKG